MRTIELEFDRRCIVRAHMRMKQGGCDKDKVTRLRIHDYHPWRIKREIIDYPARFGNRLPTKMDLSVTISLVLLETTLMVLTAEGSYVSYLILYYRSS